MRPRQFYSYALPVLQSGLSSLPIRPPDMKPLQIFQNKILRGFLKQSFNSPVASLYFLCGELPIEGKLHIDLLTLFHNTWSNPQTKLYDIVLYILKMATEKSTTWSNHLRIICKMYNLPDPLSLMQQPAMNKSAWKILVKTRVTVYHENELRSLAQANSKLEYFNVQTLSLEERSHPVLQISETRSAPKLKAHLKFLTGDINTYLNIAIERGGSPHCRLCSAPCEDTQHIISKCASTAHIRERLFTELLNQH